MRLWFCASWSVIILSVVLGREAKAALIVEEPFNYGGVSNSLAGFNGGTGFGGAWADDSGMGTFNYIPAGLTFATLATTAGAAQVGTVSNVAPYLKAEISRQFGLFTNVTGTIYGSYLFSIPYSNGTKDSLAVLFGGTNITNTGLGGTPDNNAQVDVSGLYYNGAGKGNVRLTGTGGSASGTAIATNTTYLVLWEADGLVASGTGTQKLTMWLLTSAQFDNFKPGELTSSELNAASTGTANNNVLERATLSGTFGATFLSNSFIGFYVTLMSSSTPINITFDEIRVGTGSLDEVTPTSFTSALPQITAPPVSQSVYVGSTGQMSVGASGYPALSYQWMAGAVGSGVYTNLSDNQNFFGTKSAKLTIASVSSSNAADYVVVVSNTVGAVTSSPPATLTVVIPSLPQIVTSPASQSVPGGTPAIQLNVAATGSSLSYQWMISAVGSGDYRQLTDGGNISGSASPTLILKNVSPNNSGNYIAVVSNAAGSVTSIPPATLSVYYTTNSVPDWGLGPFYRPDGVNPIISSNVSAVFTDPILNQPVNWEYTHTFNPGATVMNGKVYVLYRAEDNSGTGIGTFCSRDGLASSTDGLHFISNPTPSLYPDLDAQAGSEWPGGCEDSRLVETEDGTYVVLYTQWNRSLARLGIATSTNLIDWTKYGSPFAMYGTTTVNSNTACKSAGILTRMENGKLVAAKHLGRYWMYWGEGSVKVAVSDDCLNWRPLGPTVLTTRSGKFDSSLVEQGAPAILTAKGIVVFYNGKNANPGDPTLNPGAYSGGQALFDAKEPTKLVARMDHPFFQPEAPYEVTGQYAAGTTFIQGLVPFQNQWFLYYGAADSFVGVAVSDQSDFGLTEPWPTNCYYQDFDGFSVGTTNSLDGAILFSTALGGTAGVQDSFQKELQLTANGTPNVTSAFVLPDIASGHAIYGFSARWDSEFYYTNVSGCGLSFNLSSITNSQILTLPVESGYGNGLSVDIDNDQNGTPGFFIRVDNTIVASQAFNPDVQWGKANSYRNAFSVDWNYVNGLTLSVNGVTIFTNVPTPGFVPTPGMQFSWAARTSANTEDARLDNICVMANANLAPVSLASFVASGSTTGNSVSNAFDGNPATQWQVASSNGWIQASCVGGPQTVTAYSIVSASANWQQDPQNWTLQGSNDGNNWVVVDAEYLESWENNDALMRNVPRTFTVNQPAMYQFYRLNITTNNGAAATQLADLILYASRSTNPSPAISGIVVNNNKLVASGAAGMPLGTYYVLSSTNIGLPAKQWSVIATNQFDAAGKFMFTNSLSPTAREQFFRLSLP